MEAFVSCLSADGNAKIFMKCKQKNVWPGECKINFTICVKQSYFFFENEMEKTLNFCLRHKKKFWWLKKSSFYKKLI